METISVGALAEEFAKAAPSVVAFDADGTLWSGDVGEDFFFGIVAAHAITSDAHAALRATALAAELDDSGDASVIAQRLWDAYLAKRFPERSMCEVMAWVYAGRSIREAWDFAATFLSPRFESERPHPEAILALHAARAAGHRAVVVSASPRPIVEAAAALFGFAPHDVFAATPVCVDQRVLPDVVRPIPYGPGKATALQPHAVLAAFGDNVFDTDMLGLAVWPVAVRPKARLLEHASAVPRLRKLVLEPGPGGGVA